MKADRCAFWLQRLAVILFVLMAMPGTMLGGPWATLGIGGGILAYLLTWRATGHAPRPDREAALLVAALLGVCAALDLQAAYPALSWHMTLQLASIWVPLLAFSAPDVQKHLYVPAVFDWTPCLIAFAALPLALELKLDGPLVHFVRGPDGVLAGYNRGFSYAMLLMWPLTAALWFSPNRKRLLWVLLALVPALILTLSRATQLATVLGLGVFVVACFAPRLMRRFLQLIVFICTFWPLYAQYAMTHWPERVARLPASWLHRIEIWDYLSFHIMERPLWGWGVGASHKLEPSMPRMAAYVIAHGPAAHPHNVFTELWVELGVCGLVLGVCFASLTLKWAARQPKQIVPFALAAWSGGFILSLCAYDFWTDSFLSMMVLVSLTFTLLRKRLASV